MIIDFLRHGETETGSGFYGVTDVALTESGWQRMQQSLASHEYDLVLTSPLQRCRRFAEDYAGQHSLDCIAENDLMEMDFGDWENKTAEQLLAESPRRLEQFWASPERHGPPGGETMDNMARRVNRAVQHIGCKPVQRCLVVSHKGVIGLALLQALGAPLSALRQLRLDHAGLSRMETFNEPGSQPSVVFVNHV